MTESHDVIEELLAVRALGGLDGGDLELLGLEMEAHGDCEECRRLRDELADTAGKLGLALDPMPVSAATADRILEMAKEGEESEATDELASRRMTGMRRALALVASFIVLLVGVAIVRANIDPDVVITAQRFVELQGDEGSLVLAYTPGEPGVVVWGRDLPDPGAGSVYELWAFVDGSPASQGCLRPVDGAISAYLDVEIGDADSMAVTVESASCPGSPTRPPVYAAELT